MLPGGPELRAEILPRTLNSANQFKKTKDSTQLLNNTVLSYSSVETGFGIILIVMVSSESQGLLSMYNHQQYHKNTLFTRTQSNSPQVCGHE